MPPTLRHHHGIQVNVVRTFLKLLKLSLQVFFREFIASAIILDFVNRERA